MSDIKKLQEYELKILKEFDRICKKYKLKYYLGFGSLLGAVRHKGFIPWDDDIDIHMEIEDLLKFISVCKKELKKEFYYQYKLNDKYYYNFWLKIGIEDTTWMPKDHFVSCKYGICIDIFPMFKGKKNNRDYKRIEKYTKLLYVVSSKYYVINKSCDYSKRKVLIHKLTPDFIGNIIYKYALYKLCLRGNDYDYFVIRSISQDKNFYFDREDIGNSNYILFEDKKYLCPINTDKYLKTFYGDKYMIPPPEDKRYGHDSGGKLIIDFNNSYKKYLTSREDI